MSSPPPPPRSTIYAKPFPKSATEARVKELFAVYGRVRKVKLRRDNGTNAFRGSVYVEFESEAAAATAVSNPPHQLGSNSERLQVLFREDYERKRAHYNGSNSGQQSAGHKRQHPDSSAGGGGGGGATASGGGDGLGAAGGGHDGSSTRGMEQRIRELEEQLRAEKETSSAAMARLGEAQQRMEDALAREAAASRKLLSKDIEIGGLKGEVASLRSQMQSKVEQAHLQAKSRVQDLELSLQRCKEEVAGLRGSSNNADGRPAAPTGRSRLTPTDDVDLGSIG